MLDLRIGQPVYYARVLPKLKIYELYDLVIRTIEEDWFVAYDTRTKQAYIFTEKNLEKNVYTHRGDALEYVREREEEKDDEENKN